MKLKWQKSDMTPEDQHTVNCLETIAMAVIILTLIYTPQWLHDFLVNNF